MNLMINSIEATKSVEGRRELAIKSQRSGQRATLGVRQRYRRGASH
jgi:hypothetical protein